jgi:hypothetical protein
VHHLPGAIDLRDTQAHVVRHLAQLVEVRSDRTDRQVSSGDGHPLRLVLVYVLACIEAQAYPTKVAVPRRSTRAHHLEDRKILEQAAEIDRLEDEQYVEKRGDELPAELATSQGQRVGYARLSAIP